MRNYIILIFSTFLLLSTSTNIFSQNNRDLFFVFLNTNPDKEKISETAAEELQAAHLNNISKLNNEGKIIAAGPFNGGGGIFILRAKDLDEANNILSTDPAIAANRFNIEVFPFNIYNGDFCGSEKPYEMVEYQFIRISINDEDPETTVKAMHETRLFMANLMNDTEELIVHGRFDTENEGIMILNVPDTEAADKIMKTNSFVARGIITYDVRTLWIAEGTFCEK